MEISPSSAVTVFPARVGMNRMRHDFQGKDQSVPRASGDEPVRRVSASSLAMCSPREWG